MSTLFLGQSAAEVPVDENDVRSTVTVVNEDDAAAVQAKAPEYNDVDTDEATNGGLTTRTLASAVTPSERYAPPHAAKANTDYSDAIDSQISTAGQAPAKEASGEWGHGTMQVVEGIEPVIREGGAFGTEYFSADTRDVQNGTGAYMSATRSPDDVAAASAMQSGKTSARDAASTSLYARFYEGMTK